MSVWLDASSSEALVTGIVVNRRPSAPPLVNFRFPSFYYYVNVFNRNSEGYKFCLHKPILRFRVCITPAATDTEISVCLTHGSQILKLCVGAPSEWWRMSQIFYKFHHNVQWEFFLNLLHSGYFWKLNFHKPRRIQIYGKKRGWRYVWPFHSNSCSMTSPYSKELKKVVILRNVNFRGNLLRKNIFFSSHVVQFLASYFVLKLIILKLLKADFRVLP